MFTFDTPRPARRPNLTPMIDVVFLLLVFFMLASRFVNDSVIPMANGSAEQSAGERAVLRLVELGPEGLMLNGRAIAPEALADELTRLDDRPEAPVVLRGREARVQGLATLMDDLRAAGFVRLILVE